MNIKEYAKPFKKPLLFFESLALFPDFHCVVIFIFYFIFLNLYHTNMFNVSIHQMEIKKNQRITNLHAKINNI